MKKYIVEFIGTFFLLFVILNMINGPAPEGSEDTKSILTAMSGLKAPLAIGCGLMIMVYAGGHICGAHYNPAVTLSVFLRGKCDMKDVVPYVAVQIAGAAAAAFTVMYLKGDIMSAEVMKDAALQFGDQEGQLSLPRALLAEALGTFALCFVILNVATAKGTEGNSHYGLAIGFTVTAMAYALGGYSGGAFNPAVAFGLCVSGNFAWANIWIYLAANLGAGALAAVVFRITNGSE